MKLINTATALLLIFAFNLSYSQDTTVAPVIKLGIRTMITGTHVSLNPPEKFNYSDKLKGFVHPGSAASLMVSEAEGISWIQASQGLTQQALNGQNASILTQEDVVLDNGTTGRLFTLRIVLASNDSTKQDMEFERLMLFAGDYHYTMIINANYPALLRPVLFATVKASMLSAEMSNTLNIPAE
jgi:hypothetical protein